MTSTAPKRAALYIRLSEETDATTSPKRQREATAAYATVRGWDVVGTYEDIDVSATHARLDRPQLTLLRAAIARGEVDVVIVYKMDRLARNVLDTLILLEEWRKAGCEFASAAEGLDMTTSSGRAMATLIAVFAQMEADAISFRVTGAIAELRNTGRFAGGTVPYGYRTAPNPDGPGRVLDVDPAEAAVVREVAARLIGGEAPYRVCQDLNTRAIPAPRSEYRKTARAGKDVTDADRGAWRVQSLRRTFTSDHLVGRVIHHGEVRRGANGLPESVWAPIIDSGTLALLRARLSPKADTPTPRRVRAARLLSGLTFCAACGSKMYVGSASGRPVYGCHTSSNGEVCPSPRISALGLEPHVVAEVMAAFGDHRMTETVDVVEETTHAADLADVERAITTTLAAMGAEDADMPLLSARLIVLKATLADLQTAASNAVIFSTVRETVLSLAETYAEAVDDRARREILSEWIKAVRISPTASRSSVLDAARVEIEWVPTDAEAVA